MYGLGCGGGDDAMADSSQIYKENVRQINVRHVGMYKVRSTQVSLANDLLGRCLCFGGV